MEQLLQLPVNELTYDQLDSLVRHLNDSYRVGIPLVSDELFDQVYLKALREHNPNHDYFTSPQPENLSSKGRVPHGDRRMLSTQKAYELKEIEAWVKRCRNAAFDVGVDPDSLLYRLTPKLDGLAGRYEPDPLRLVSRGDGDFGYDLSHLFDLGLKVIGRDDEHAVGEIILDEIYYQDNLSEVSPHPRNFVAGIASADDLNDFARKALVDGAVHLVLYRDIDTQHVDANTLLSGIDQLVQQIKDNSHYRLDGVVIEIVDERVKSAMGSTNHHHNWQIAKKSQGETAVAVVEDVLWQVSRTGRVNPVIKIESTLLEGCNIQKLTAHHAKNLINQGIGKGAKIEIVRSGSVIPTHVKTHERVEANVPDYCPCCSHELIWDGDFLVCEGPQCREQAATRLEHHFKTIQADLFGPKTIQKLIEAGYDTIQDIYPLSEDQLMAAGFGPGQSKNIVNEISRVRTEPLRDFLLLGSLGIKALGRGASKKLLAVHPLENVLDISSNDLLAIEGFGDKTSVSIVRDLEESAETLTFLLTLGFNIDPTKKGDTPKEGPLVGLNIVFTGKMSGNRSEMQEEAQMLGAICQSSVNGKTQLLVCGENVGQSKLTKAEKHGVRIISEADYKAEFLH